MKSKLTHQKGFTIIESLISVLMLALVIGAVSGLVQRSLATNMFSKEQVVANYLAGEAVEYVRNVRDSNFVGNRAWLTGLSQCINQTCKVDTIQKTFSVCNSTEDCRLRFVDDTSSGYYSHQISGTTESNYYRTVELRQIGGNPNELAVVVTISSDRGLFSRIPLIVVEHMHNWGSN